MTPAIAWCDALLSRWGRYALKCESKALGYAACSILAGAHEGEGLYEPAPPPDVTNEDFEAITQAVNKLPHVLIVCVVQVYQQGAGKSDVKNAATLGISRQALKEYIHKAQRQIAAEISLKGNRNDSRSIHMQ